VQTGHSGDVHSVAYSKDGKYIASACIDGSVKLFDARLGFEIFTFYDFNESAGL
jgi:WD40 repeat protein